MTTRPDKVPIKVVKTTFQETHFLTLLKIASVRAILFSAPNAGKYRPEKEERI